MEPQKTNPSKSRMKTLVAVGSVAVLALIGLAVIHVTVDGDGANGGQEDLAQQQRKLDYLEVVRKEGEGSSKSPPSTNWDSAVEFADESLAKNTNLDTAIEKLSQLQDQLEGDKQLVAKNKIEELSRLKKEVVDDVISELKRKTNPLIDKKKYRQAGKIMQNYTPPPGKEYLAKATEIERLKIANEYFSLANKQDEFKKQAEAKVRQNKRRLLAGIAPEMMTGKFKKALREFKQNPNSVSYPKIKNILRQLVEAEDVILASFKKDVGESIIVEHHGKKQKLKIKYVENGMVYGEDKVGRIAVGVKFKVKDLSASETASRLESLDKAPRNIYLAADRLRERDFDDAKKRLAETGVFKDVLMDEYNKMLAKGMEHAAKSYLIKILRKARIASKTFDPKQIKQDLDRISFSPKQAKYLMRIVSEYREKFKGTDFAKTHDKVLLLVSAKAEEDLKKAMSEAKTKKEDREKKTLSFTGKVTDKESLYRALKATNPEYNLKAQIKTDDRGNIVSLSLKGAKISDIAVLEDLEKLDELDITNTKVSDISPVRRMKLEKLSLTGTKVSDLTPLRGMKSLKKLDIRKTPVEDVTPLRGLKIEELAFDPAKIKNKRGMEYLRKMDQLKKVITPKGPEDTMKFWIKYDAGDFSN